MSVSAIDERNKGGRECARVSSSSSSSRSGDVCVVRESGRSSRVSSGVSK